ncbi:MAG: hypothetical protein AB7F89_21165 [Pirellulaceae bacterium]
MCRSNRNWYARARSRKCCHFRYEGCEG